jgi:hypothetical protein
LRILRKVKDYILNFKKILKKHKSPGLISGLHGLTARNRNRRTNKEPVYQQDKIDDSAKETQKQGKSLNY